MHRLPALVTAFGLSLAGACVPVGPTTIQADQVGYAEAIGDAAMRLTLLNLVRIRYGGAPTFIQTSQVVAGYSLSTNASLNLDLDTAGGWTLGNDGGLGVGATFSNNPTITYSPITGQDFAALLMTPQNPTDLFGMMLSGIAPQLVLGMGVDEINGLRNAASGARGMHPADPEFVEMVDLIGELHGEGKLRPRMRKVGAVRSMELILAPDRPGASPDARKRRLRTLLGLTARTDSFQIVYGAEPEKPDQIAVLTRSLAQIMIDIAYDIEVPAADVARGSTFAIKHEVGETPPVLRIDIRSAPSGAPLQGPPDDAFVAVRYQSTWYYLSDNDFMSKRAFTFMMTLIRMVEDSKSQALPVITIPAG